MKAVLLGTATRDRPGLSQRQTGCNPQLLYRIMKVAIGIRERSAARRQPGIECPGACSFQIIAAATTSVTKRDRQCLRPHFGPDECAPKSVWWFSTDELPAYTRKFRIQYVEQNLVSRRTTAGYGAKSWWLPLRRLCPVNTSTLKCVVWFICHNSKGKAKYAIILMDFSAEAKSGFSALDSRRPRIREPGSPTGFSVTISHFRLRRILRKAYGKLQVIFEGKPNAEMDFVKALRLAHVLATVVLAATTMSPAPTVAETATDPILAYGARIAGEDPRTRI